jgi:hypothetical protein
MKTIKTLFLTISMVQIAYSQNNIAGSISDNNGNILPFVTIGLLKADSTIFKATATDEKGHFQLDNLGAKEYILKATYIGYSTYFSKTIKMEELDIELPMVILYQNTTELNEVTVVTRKPFLEQQIDRTIVNVANSIIGSSGTALDAIAQAPGITVDYQNEQIELRGKDGVLVQIDGKITYLSGPDLTAMLRGMSSDNIDKIEIITNPSAKYDASGNAGIINIVLKKNVSLGTNGVYTLGLGSGVHYRSRSSLGLNHRTKKINIFGNYSINKGGNFFDLAISRTQPDGDLQNMVNQNTHLVFDVLGQNAKIGLDYFLNKNTTIGMTLTGIWNNHDEAGLATFKARRSTTTPIYSEASTQKTLDNVAQNKLVNVNMQHNLKNKGQFSIDFDYGYFGKEFANSLITTTITQDVNREKLVPELLNETVTDIEINTLKADYSLPLSEIWKFETGVKYANVISKNEVILKSGESGNLLIDPNLTSDFSYTERVNAGYINFSGKINKIEVQAGLRAEHTHSVGKLSEPNKTKVRDYLNWFPSLFLSKPISDKQTLLFSYSYRIDRPNYQNINPARSFVDLFAYSIGNIDLNPQYTHALELRYALESGTFISLASNYVSGVMLHIMNVTEGNKAYRSSENVGDSKGYTITVSQPITISNAWQIQATLMGYQTKFNFEYEGKSFIAQNLSSRLNVNNGFVLPKGFTAELNAWVNSPSVFTIIESPWMSNVDAGLQKNVSKTMKLKLSVQNVFNTAVAKNTISGNYSSQKAIVRLDTRIVMLSMTYPFGNQKVKAASQRKVGIEDESRRTN